MLNPISASEVGHYQYQDRLKEAERWRLYRQFKGNRPGFLHRFKVAMQGLKPHTQTNLAEPCFDGS